MTSNPRYIRIGRACPHFAGFQLSTEEYVAADDLDLQV
jgi:hypothetical protein